MSTKLAEIERELRMRRAVYPKQVAAGKMKPEEAEARIAAMEGIAADYRGDQPDAPREPVYFLDGEAARVARWHEPSGDALGHYAVDPKGGTYSGALATVGALLAQRDELAALVQRYGGALSEIARPHRGPTFEAASKHRQEIALRALGRE